MTETTSVLDDAANSRLIFESEGHTAELVYKREDDRFVIVHTGVPKVLEGRGIGTRLVRAAVKMGVAEGLTIVPQCPFARRWMRQHGHQLKNVSVDWGLESNRIKRS